MSKKTKQHDLESSLVEIQSLIENMEKGDLTLEQSLTHFERGITLIKQAQKILQEAEQKVSILMKQNNNDTLTPYESDDE